jgi:hypothetical protein
MRKLFLLPGGLICDAVGLTEDSESTRSGTASIRVRFFRRKTVKCGSVAHAKLLSTANAVLD